MIGKIGVKLLAKLFAYTLVHGAVHLLVGDGCVGAGRVVQHRVDGGAQLVPILGHKMAF